MTHRWTPQDLDAAQSILDDLLAEVRAEEGPLSAGTKLGAGAQALQRLRETRVSFGNPTDALIRLTPKLFESLGVELNEIRRRQMREQFDFYYMTLSVSLQPGRGVQFRRVECALDFGPKGANEPIVQRLFPAREWNEVLRWGGGLKLTLNGDLDWGVGVPGLDATQVEALPGRVRARVSNADALRSLIVVPDYAFSLGRAEVAASGEGNSECFWRIERPDLQQTQTVTFGVVFKVPQSMSTITLTGLVAAEPSMSWLTAHLRNVFEGLSERLQQFLRRTAGDGPADEGLSVGDHETWALTLPR